MVLDRGKEIDRLDREGVDFDKDIYHEAYTELEALLGFEWLEMDESNRKILTYMALFPHQNDFQIQKFCGSEAFSFTCQAE